MPIIELKGIAQHQLQGTSNNITPITSNNNIPIIKLQAINRTPIIKLQGMIRNKSYADILNI